LNWLIIGGQSQSSGCQAKQPEYEWTFSMTLFARSLGISVYWKPNLLVPKERPNNVDK